MQAEETIKLPCKAEEQYLITLQVNRDCLLALQSRIHIVEHFLIISTCLMISVFS